MTIRIVRLGTNRSRGEGLRIGTVRRPPRGIPKSEFASQNWYDVWLPNIAPTSELMKLGKVAKSDKEWAAFVRKYRTYQWAVTVKMRSAVTGSHYASYWLREGRNSNEPECNAT